jgi:hypothetical protein
VNFFTKRLLWVTVSPKIRVLSPIFKRFKNAPVQPIFDENVLYFVWIIFHPLEVFSPNFIAFGIRGNLCRVAFYVLYFFGPFCKAFIFRNLHVHFNTYKIKKISQKKRFFEYFTFFFWLDSTKNICKIFVRKSIRNSFCQFLIFRSLFVLKWTRNFPKRSLCD